jgi:deoxyribonuclease-4
MIDNSMVLSMNKLIFGTAGIPLSTENPTTENGIEKVRELGLDAMELEFVRSINIKKDKAPEIKEVATKNNVVLTCHAPYFINLNAREREKLEASKLRILNSARIAWMCGAWSVVFHAAFYMGGEKERVYEKVRDEIKDIVRILMDEGVEIWIRPELTGKPTQFGELEELIKISQEVEMVMPCIDFAHLHARYNGRFNSKEEWQSVLEKIEDGIGKQALDNIHIHVSGINYTERGERNHLNLEESDLNYVELMHVLKDFNVNGVVISESPNIEQDALLMKNTYEKW